MTDLAKIKPAHLQRIAYIYVAKNELATAGPRVYSVTKSGKQPAWLRDEFSGGRAGCSRSLQLIFDQTAADLVECYVGE